MAKPNYKKVAFHVLTWVAIFIIGTILIPGYSLRVGAVNTLVSWALYVFVFYLNYLWLIPRFFNRRWMGVYVLAAAAVLFVSFVIVRRTAVEAARRDSEKLSEQIQLYADVRDSFAEKERNRDRQRDIQRHLERDENHPAEEFPILPPPDSAMRARMDSLMKINTTLTPREEEYGQRRLEYDGLRNYARRLSRSGLDPFSRQNMPFSFALILFYMASIVVYFTEQSGKTEKRRRELEEERATAELAYLKQQINPHFLFNTLNSIYSYTIGVSAEASDAILKLSSILRYMLYETHRDRVPLSDELAVMADYIELHRLRITEQTDIEVTVTGNPIPHRIEPMLLIPIVENAFKYGVDSVEPSFVKIALAIEGERLTFRSTNRIVRRNQTDSHHSGIGINNIRRRLELIYGPEHYELTAGESGGVFSVTLRIDLKG